MPAIENAEAPSLIMVRTVCCEGYKECGRRCAICPNRPENRAAVLAYRKCASEFGCKLRCSDECALERSKS
jgi:hypothetical protein